MSRKKTQSEMKFLFRLYVSGNTAQSLRALMNFKDLCEEQWPNRYQLDVVDIFKSPQKARQDHIMAAPTLIKLKPGQQKRILGDLSNKAKVLKALQGAVNVGSAEGRL